MGKAWWLKVINSVLFVSAAVQVLTGISLFFDLFITNTRIFTVINRLHAYNGFVLAGLVVVHIVLNWGWVRTNFLKRGK